MSRSSWWWPLLLGAVLSVAPQFGYAGPPVANAPAASGRGAQDVGAQVAAARARNEALQAQVASMEKRNTAQQEALRQRDVEIAKLRDQLKAAGAPASAASARVGH